MKAPASLALPGALAALLAMGLAVLPSGGSLGAFSSVLTTLADADLDGLDDALEARLKTDPNNPDSDGDTVSDLEEALLGTDPNVADLPTAFPALAPKLYIDAYALGTDMVIQIAAHVQQSVLLPTFIWADDDSLLTLSISDLRAFRVDHGIRPSARANWNIAFARFLIPRAVVENEPSVGIAIRAIIDGTDVAAAMMFTHVNGYLAQFRVGVGSAAMSWTGNGVPGFQGTPSSQGGGANSSSGGNGGGLFPVDPSEGGAPSTSTPDEVCIQVLEPTANLGGGRVAYRVADAYCDSLPQALCFSGCVGTIDDIVVGIDIIGLLGG